MPRKKKPKAITPEATPEQPTTPPAEMTDVEAKKMLEQHKQPEPPEQKPAKTWAETVRPWSATDIGVQMVSTTSPDMIGIKFPEHAHADTDEKIKMAREAGLKYWPETKAYLVNKPPASEPAARVAQWDKVEQVFNEIVDNRRAQAEERGR